MVQAIAWLRTGVLNVLLLEFEEEILFWRGKEIAREEKLNDIHQLQNFFIQKGLGILEFHWHSQQYVKVGITNTPLAFDYKNSQKTIALECGLITEMLQQKYQKKAEGTAKWVASSDTPPYIEVTVILEQD